MASALGPNVIAFAAHGAQVEVHRHHCFQIVISLNAAFDCTLGGIAYLDKTGFIINQNIPHSCAARRASVLVYFVDAESYHGWQLKELLAGASFIDVEPLFAPAERARYLITGDPFLPKEELHALAENVFATILPAAATPTNELLDERVSRAIIYIDARLADNLRLEEIADLIGLSPERARHLFAQQTGVPFSQYVLWKRLKNVITLVVRDGGSLTEAALASGFADQSHFCRVFKRMFGVSAKTHLKNSRYVQFLNPLT